MANHEIMEAACPGAVRVHGDELLSSGRDGRTRAFAPLARLRALAGLGMGLNHAHKRTRFADTKATFRFSVAGGAIFKANFANQINTSVPTTFRK
jgi:hypothetical protein